MVMVCHIPGHIVSCLFDDYNTNEMVTGTAINRQVRGSSLHGLDIIETILIFMLKNKSYSNHYSLFLPFSVPRSFDQGLLMSVSVFVIKD